VLLTGFLHNVLSVVTLELQWLIDIFSVAVLYRALYYTFDRFIWKWSLLRKLGIVTVPDLNGMWKGRVTSSYKSDDNTYSISVVITQQWSKILIQLHTDKSYSKSITASFLPNDSTSPELVYVYESDPNALAPKSMESHGGTAKLRLEGSTLRGQYYTGRGRGTIGDIVLECSKDNKSQ
ncbi:MAG: hypothetical protein OXC46_01065, partial [Thaumarchaeota archaeon]|nr:hypothetical protein [Nitrososphaerota archaeon]